jgi:hypothetical protein
VHPGQFCFIITSMIPLAIAQTLKAAGLVWKPTLNDFFAIPGSDLDDRIFVLSELMASQTMLRDWPAITFHGTAEWALDYIFLHEVVWMPTEEQLRQELVYALDHSQPATHLTLMLRPDGRYEVTILFSGQQLTFAAATASEVYAAALLHVLRHTPAG